MCLSLDRLRRRALLVTRTCNSSCTGTSYRGIDAQTRRVEGNAGYSGDKYKSGALGARLGPVIRHRDQIEDIGDDRDRVHLTTVLSKVSRARCEHADRDPLNRHQGARAEGAQCLPECAKDHQAEA